MNTLYELLRLAGTLVFYFLMYLCASMVVRAYGADYYSGAPVYQPPPVVVAPPPVVIAPPEQRCQHERVVEHDDILDTNDWTEREICSGE